MSPALGAFLEAAPGDIPDSSFLSGYFFPLAVFSRFPFSGLFVPALENLPADLPGQNIFEHHPVTHKAIQGIDESRWLIAFKKEMPNPRKTIANEWQGP